MLGSFSKISCDGFGLSNKGKDETVWMNELKNNTYEWSEVKWKLVSLVRHFETL